MIWIIYEIQNNSLKDKNRLIIFEDLFVFEVDCMLVINQNLYENLNFKYKKVNNWL